MKRLGALGLAVAIAGCAHDKAQPLPQGSPTPFSFEPTPAYPPIEWIASLNEAKARASEEHRPLIVFVRAAWAKQSVDMDATVWRDARVLAEVGRFIAVRVDLTSNYGKDIPDYLGDFQVKDIPTTVILGTDGRMTAHFAKGDANAKDVAAVLKLTN